MITTEQKYWIGEIKDVLKLVSAFLDVVEDNVGVSIKVYFGGINRNESFCGFSYCLNSKEDFSVVLGSIPMMSKPPIL